MTTGPTFLVRADELLRAPDLLELGDVVLDAEVVTSGGEHQRLGIRLGQELRGQVLGVERHLLEVPREAIDDSPADDRKGVAGPCGLGLVLQTLDVALASGKAADLHLLVQEHLLLVIH